MNDGFDDEQDSSQSLSEMAGRVPQLNARQRAIHQGLKDIGEEIAAFYLDGLKILQDDNLLTTAYLLAHIAREIDGGLRDILSEDIKEEFEFVIHTPDEEILNYERKKADTIEFAVNMPGAIKLEYKPIQGKRITSILDSLGIDDPSPLAERWINVTKNFAKFAHRQGAWEHPRRIEDFEGLWLEFEGVLAGLVGNYLNLLDRLDRIRTAEPTKERRGALRNLLESEARRAYFFSRLESPAWLEPLREDGWFDPGRNPMPQESPDQPGYYYNPRWHALEYVVKISTHPETDVSVCVNIVNSIINYTYESGERVENDHTDLQTIRIIGALPIAELKRLHIDFIGTLLKSERRFGLIDQEIGETILTKLLAGGKRELALTLIAIMLEVESHEPDIRTVMDDYWLEDALKNHVQTITKLCGIEAAQIALEKIREIAIANRFMLDFIERVESDLSLLSHPNYAELMVSFTSSVFRYAKPDSIERTIQSLLQDPITIIRRIAVKAIADHYSNLRHLFWGWEGNPLDEIELKPEVYQLIQTNSGNFNEDEMEQVLQWIESTRN